MHLEKHLIEKDPSVPAITLLALVEGVYVLCRWRGARIAGGVLYLGYQQSTARVTFYPPDPPSHASQLTPPTHHMFDIDSAHLSFSFLKENCSSHTVVRVNHLK